MAEVIGYLNDAATYGEKRVLDALRSSLPNDYSIYVECPLHDDDMERMPDFIVLTSSGVVILEVKDWVEVVQADQSDVRVRTLSGRIRPDRSPVVMARQYARVLAEKLQQRPELPGKAHTLEMPWGYAVVLPNIGPAVLTQLRKPWGEQHVMGMGDLQPHVATERLKATLPTAYDMLREDVECVRSVINPVAFIGPNRRAVILDDVQEHIVTEPPHLSERPPAPEPTTVAVQEQLFGAAEPEPPPTSAVVDALPDADIQSWSIRLLRGVAGSGKTLVLTQRARYLAAQHPQWQIAIVTYSVALADSLRASFRGMRNVEVMHFPALCTSLLPDRAALGPPSDPETWLVHHAERFPVASDLGVDFVSREIRWIKELEIHSRGRYLEAERKGRGQGLRRGGRQRSEIYDLLCEYDAWLTSQGAHDWADVPNLLLKAIEAGTVALPRYNAILVDEAQDFAPSWIRVLRRLMHADGGLLFMADGPPQSVYSQYGWREKGIPVVGRTRWLRIPYRNTREISQAAYEVVREDELLLHDFEEHMGAPIEPDLDNGYLRHVPRPQLREFHSIAEEIAFVRDEIEWLLQQGYDAQRIAVMHRRSAGADRLANALADTGVSFCTFHGPRGLEFDAVFLCQMQEPFRRGIGQSARALWDERRIVNMAMTRARARLYLSCTGRWPEALNGVRAFTDLVTI